MKILIATVVILFSGSAQAQEVVWPEDLKASLEGNWVSEWGGLKVEVKDGNVFVRSLGRSGAGGMYRDALNKQIAKIGEFDRSLDTPTYRTFTGTCFNMSSSWEPHDCKGTLNRVATGRKHSIMSFAHGLFHPEKEVAPAAASDEERTDDVGKRASVAQPSDFQEPSARPSYSVTPRPEPCRIKGCVRPI